MGGGEFNYLQCHINDIIEHIEQELNQQGKEKDISDSYLDSEYYKKYPEERFYPTHQHNVQIILKDSIEALKIAYVYAQRVDKYLSGDDGEESLIIRLEEDLKQLNKE
jgi:hypothetical protein